MGEKLVGKVKWFSAKKGFGFIQSPLLKRDIFVHFKDIDSKEKYKNLSEGQPVEFELRPSPKGERAIKVAVIKA